MHCLPKWFQGHVCRALYATMFSIPNSEMLQPIYMVIVQQIFCLFFYSLSIEAESFLYLSPCSIYALVQQNVQQYTACLKLIQVHSPRDQQQDKSIATKVN